MTETGNENIRRIEEIKAGKTALGIEFGSTRIKAVLIGSDHKPIASGGHDWENQLENGVWTYSLESVKLGLQDAYAKLVKDVADTYGVILHTVGAIGISAMMHGYLVFDEKDQLLVPFRTWRNTMTAEASEKLTELFNYPVPQRWSIAHLYQAILKKEPHVKNIRFMTTLEGYVHWLLTGQKVLGIGDVAGMFPVDVALHDFDPVRIRQFDELIADEHMPWKLADILPKALTAGEDAGVLTAEGAALLDPSGNLQPGIPMCPPEGDAGTGMTATNSVAIRTGNVSAGTSVFAMVVLEKPLKKVHPELDLVTTPAGDMVAMVHCNNCTSELNAWAGMFREFAELMGLKTDAGEVFTRLYQKALEGKADGGMISCNYLSGEHITGFEEGRPLFVRRPDAPLALADFMKVQLYASLGTLKTGMDILSKEENVNLDMLIGHGGFFKTPVVGQRLMAAAAGVPVAVMETAGEGGAWGAALLAGYRVWKDENESLNDYLAKKVFSAQKSSVIEPKTEEQEEFTSFMNTFRSGLAIERAAIEHL